MEIEHNENIKVVLNFVPVVLLLEWHILGGGVHVYYDTSWRLSTGMLAVL